MENKIKLRVTRDSNANLKILKRLEYYGCIEIFDVKTENNTNKVLRKVLPAGVRGVFKRGEFIRGGGDNYTQIKKIIGEGKIHDVIKLEAHIRNRFDYFVTEDHDFLDKREELREILGVKIVTPQELEGMYR